MNHTLITLAVFTVTTVFGQSQDRDAKPEIEWPVRDFSISSDEKIWLISNQGKTYYANSIDSNWHHGKPILNAKDKSTWSSTFKKISFFNRDTAILTGFISLNIEKTNLNGVYVTNDGGNTWKLFDFGGNTGISTVFVDRNGNAWMGGFSGKICYSRDFGQHWELLNSPYNFKSQLNSIFMLNSNEGISGALHNAIYSTTDNWKSNKKIVTPLDQKKYVDESYYVDDEIKKVAFWDNYIIVKQNNYIFYSDLNNIDWKSFPLKIIDFEVDRDRNKLFTVSEDLKIICFTAPTEFEVINDKRLRSFPVDMEVVNHSLFIMCIPNDVYKVNENNFRCRTPFSYNCFCQDTIHSFVTEEKAIRTAKKNGLYAGLFLNERFGWTTPTARLDTASRLWEVQTDKMTYRNWGKTSKQSKSDYCHSCKHTNGCHVIKNRIVWIDAITGKVLKREKKKRVAGNYE